MTAENASVAITNEAIKKMDDLIDTCERGRDILNHVATTVRSARLQLTGEKVSRVGPQGAANISAAAKSQWHMCPQRCGIKHRAGHAHMKNRKVVAMRKAA